MRKSLRLGSYVFTLALGAAVGMYAGNRVGEGADFVREILVSVHPSMLESIVLDQGTDEARAQALISQIQFEQNKKLAGLPSASRSYETDLMFTDARLAAIAERQGDPNGAKKYMDEALRACFDKPTKDQMANCAPEKMAEFAARLDAIGAPKNRPERVPASEVR